MGAAAVAGAAPKKILFFTKCSNFEHSVVRERAGQPSFAAQVLRELGVSDAELAALRASGVIG